MRPKISRKGIFLNDNDSDVMAHTVPVGTANQHLEYVQDIMGDRTLADLDPINQMIMLEEMDEWEAKLLVLDLYRKL